MSSFFLLAVRFACLERIFGVLDEVVVAKRITSLGTMWTLMHGPTFVCLVVAAFLTTSLHRRRMFVAHVAVFVFVFDFFCFGS
jgi:hypothetical protein